MSARAAATRASGSDFVSAKTALICGASAVSFKARAMSADCALRSEMEPGSFRASCGSSGLKRPIASHA